jgi:cytochrome b6-f complex subunit 5
MVLGWPALVVKELWRASASRRTMIEPLLCGIVLGLIPVTLVGLFVAAWNQYRRGGALGG